MTDDMSDDRSRRRSADEEIREAQTKQRLREEAETIDLDQALADSFPASDPPSMTAPGTRVGAPKCRQFTDGPARRRQKRAEVRFGSGRLSRDRAAGRS